MRSLPLINAARLAACQCMGSWPRQHSTRAQAGCQKCLAFRCNGVDIIDCTSRTLCACRKGGWLRHCHLHSWLWLSNSLAMACIVHPCAAADVNRLLKEKRAKGQAPRNVGESSARVGSSCICARRAASLQGRFVPPT